MTTDQKRKPLKCKYCDERFHLYLDCIEHEKTCSQNPNLKANQ